MRRDWFVYKPEHNKGRKRARFSCKCPGCGEINFIGATLLRNESVNFISCAH